MSVETPTQIDLRALGPLQESIEKLLSGPVRLFGAEDTARAAIAQRLENGTINPANHEQTVDLVLDEIDKAYKELGSEHGLDDRVAEVWKEDILNPQPLPTPREPYEQAPIYLHSEDLMGEPIIIPGETIDDFEVIRHPSEKLQALIDGEKLAVNLADLSGTYTGYVVNAHDRTYNFYETYFPGEHINPNADELHLSIVQSEQEGAVLVRIEGNDYPVVVKMDAREAYQFIQDVAPENHPVLMQAADYAGVENVAVAVAENPDPVTVVQATTQPPVQQPAQPASDDTGTLAVMANMGDMDQVMGPLMEIIQSILKALLGVEINIPDTDSPTSAPDIAESLVNQLADAASQEDPKAALSQTVEAFMDENSITDEAARTEIMQMVEALPEDGLNQVDWQQVSEQVVQNLPEHEQPSQSGPGMLSQWNNVTQPSLETPEVAQRSNLSREVFAHAQSGTDTMQVDGRQDPQLQIAAATQAAPTMDGNEARVTAVINVLNDIDGKIHVDRHGVSRDLIGHVNQVAGALGMMNSDFKTTYMKELRERDGGGVSKSEALRALKSTASKLMKDEDNPSDKALLKEVKDTSMKDLKAAEKAQEENMRNEATVTASAPSM